MKIQDYCLSEDFTIPHSGWSDPKVLPAGTFVKPIDKRYVPKHVLDDERWKRYNNDKEVFCYTSAGMVPIERRLIRKI